MADRDKPTGSEGLLGQPLFGGYVITRKIGAGGMGEVYLVENSELRKKLAIKVLLPDRSNSNTAAARFLAEARGASAINHRNIISILDASRLPDGRHYMLMEYLEGTTLRRYARGLGPMPLDVTLAILAQVCSGLQAAHDRGIIHRDLKPSNIFVSPQPDNPYFTKILDFGIAKLDDPSLAGEVKTKSQTVAGTPNYMSPEQARALRDVDHRADIYSVGVMAYELLTGRLPYKAKSVGDLVYQQSSTTPIRAGELRRDLPPAWDDLIHRAMALEPSERPQSAQELAKQMIDATARGDEIARATASLLFTALSESSSFSAAPPPSHPRPVSATGTVDPAELDDGAGEIAGARQCLSRTMSVPAEGFENFRPEQFERGTADAVGSEPPPRTERPSARPRAISPRAVSIAFVDAERSHFEPEAEASSHWLWGGLLASVLSGLCVVLFLAQGGLTVGEIKLADDAPAADEVVVPAATRGADGVRAPEFDPPEFLAGEDGDVDGASGDDVDGAAAEDADSTAEESENDRAHRVERRARSSRSHRSRKASRAAKTDDLRPAPGRIRAPAGDDDANDLFELRK